MSAGAFIILTILLVYFFQLAVSMTFNALNSTRDPRGVTDFLRLTFLPYVLLKRKEIRS